MAERQTDSPEPADTIRAVDLFCGAGGLSWGLVEALKEAAINANQPTDAVLDDCIDLVGVNHWEVAIQTHERNHPWARHFHDDVQNVNPSEVFDDPNPSVKILSGGIECTHWSGARGGKPVDEQKRMPAWDVHTWVQKLRPENVLLENVPEFESWGPIEDDGTPTRNGETFEAWVNGLHSLGYSVDWQVLNAADYGDATSRERLFIMARREHKPEFPEPTHSKTGAGDTDEWRTAAEIIDWTERGQSVWTRGLRGNGKRPLASNTMQRIAQGIRRYGHDRLGPYADALDELGTERDREDGKDVTLTADLQEDVVPVEEAAAAADERDEPFLVRAEVVEAEIPADREHGDAVGLCVPLIKGQHGGSVPRDAGDQPVQTVTTDGNIQLYEPEAFVLPRNQVYGDLHSNGAYEPDDRPLHTVTARNHDGHLVTPYLVPYYGERDGQTPRTHGLDDPLPTVTATGSDPYLAKPYLTVYNGESGAVDVEEPLPTVTTRDRFGLVVPEFYPWGLDVRYRMLQPRELAAAQGFPEDYDFAGSTKKNITEQIGNAVPVNLAQSLVESLLVSSTPTLTDYLDRDVATIPDATADAGQGGAVGDD